jgi:hypothetical protein
MTLTTLANVTAVNGFVDLQHNKQGRDVADVEWRLVV